MSASKFALYGTALFRAPRTLPKSPSFHFSKPFPLRPQRFHRCFSSVVVDIATADDTEIISSGNQQLHHPWPEWISFVDHLKSKGYLTESSPPPSSSVAEERDGIDDSTDGNSVYSNINLLKDACLSFGRQRYDVFKLLSMKDIQAVVEGGCPNLFRKTVNSAKRIRAHVHLDEGDVCGACNLRGSCDRAYVILKEPEAAARTVDIARILLFHALDPLVICGGEKSPGEKLLNHLQENF
ncbi:hypothetical protein L6164_005420 [Bauhinia variegata]|uniref:Uncharacterized protein n=1 Tax=Bauhinia variegata TaxID=167791 RepID=A0ACB9PTU9_BAUVA|nr:hypothetical protein L6164_005420 [Bauhinia variegata]